MSGVNKKQCMNSVYRELSTNLVQSMPNEVVGTNSSLFEQTPQETKRFNIILSGVNITGNIHMGRWGAVKGGASRYYSFKTVA